MQCICIIIFVFEEATEYNNINLLYLERYKDRGTHWRVYS